VFVVDCAVVHEGVERRRAGGPSIRPDSSHLPFSCACWRYALTRPADCVPFDRSLGEELRLKRQIAARLSNDTSAVEMCDLARLWALQPYLDTGRVAFVNALARCFAS
jgi:hypothetical protein